jgi:hypothetical protein
VPELRHRQRGREDGGWKWQKGGVEWGVGCLSYALSLLILLLPLRNLAGRPTNVCSCNGRETLVIPCYICTYLYIYVCESVPSSIWLSSHPTIPQLSFRSSSQLYVQLLLSLGTLLHYLAVLHLLYFYHRNLAILSWFSLVPSALVAKSLSGCCNKQYYSNGRQAVFGGVTTSFLRAPQVAVSRNPGHVYYLTLRNTRKLISRLYRT